MSKGKSATTPTTELSLLANILANPTDAVALEVYADFLQEQGAERAEDEARVRAEAKAIRKGKGPLTFEQILALDPSKHDRRQEANAWTKRQEHLLKRAVRAALPGRARLLDGNDNVQLEVDKLPVTLYVGHSVTNSAVSERVRCRIAVRWGQDWTLQRSKNGFNIHTVVAGILSRVEACHTGDRERAKEGERVRLRKDAVARVRERFGLPQDGPLQAMSEDAKMRLTLERTPEEMERLLQVLTDAGLLPEAKK